jgi:V/A-type H+-transporting ATPase subunit G/H
MQWGEKMAKEVWEKVKEAEAKAAKAIEDAKLQSVEIVKKAREEAAELVKAAERQSVADGEKLLAERVTRIKEFKKEQIHKVEEELQHLLQTSSKRIDGAVNLILEKVVR